MYITMSNGVDGHETDLVMPGFRFHPTEEELIDFYLRRKVEGKRFNVDLIAFLDLYRFDPWELPAMAIVGEKEWFFYVPRDRKYRNGDRPNRVTTSGYWKATGADRVIRAESSPRPIGLKKTLVFYYGKAPRGIRSGWIMNEYRLLQNDQLNRSQNHKTEISICRVYKRGGGLQDCKEAASFKDDGKSKMSALQEICRKEALCNTISSSSSSRTPTINQIFVSSDNAVFGADARSTTQSSISSEALQFSTRINLSSSSSSPLMASSRVLHEQTTGNTQQCYLDDYLNHLLSSAAAAASSGLWQSNTLHKAGD